MGWFNSLSALEKTYFIIACVASVFLIIQILFMVFGGDGDADADGDIDGDGASDGGGDSGVTPFSVKGIVAFFAVGGWTGNIEAKPNPEKSQPSGSDSMVTSKPLS